jgi:cytidine deaminase
MAFNMGVLIERAKAVREHAFAPLTGVKVGAILRAKDGTEFPGCNIESPSGIFHTCAERTALVTALCAGHREFSHVVVVGDFHAPIPPCGYCRQALLEFAPGLRVIMATLSGESREALLEDLMPLAYSIKDRAS